MFCNKCGGRLMDGAKFCSRCGAPVKSGQAEAQAAQKPVVSSAEPAPAPQIVHNEVIEAIPERMRNIDYSESFATALLAPWITGSVNLHQATLEIRTSNAVLGLIPAGEDVQTVPLSNVSNVAVSSSYRAGLIAFGVLLCLVGLLCLPSGGGNILMGIVLLALGVVCVLNGPQTALVLQCSGTDVGFPVPFYEKEKMEGIKEEIDNALAYTETKKDNLFATAISVETSKNNTRAIVDAINESKSA